MATRRKPASERRTVAYPAPIPARPRDEGTADLQRHRLGLANGAHDPALSASLAGILFAHGVISPALDGPGGVQASFHFVGAKNTAAGRMPAVTPHLRIWMGACMPRG